MERPGVKPIAFTTLPAEASQRIAESALWGLPAPITWGQQAKHFQMVGKRLLDLLVAAAILLVLAIPLTLLMVLIKLESPGPIFFTQRRVGYSGRPFRMYKFRSMVVNAEARRAGLESEVDAPLFKMRRDPRRTRAGQVIRRFSIDEVPQLFNVICGHMSLVGPRPALVEEAGDPISPYHAHRVMAMPGMTGLWQVSGRSLLSFEETVALDLRYAREWSLWLDIKILFRTIPVVLTGKGAY